MSQNKTEFDWGASESAPDHYPMEIIRGDFFYKGQTHGLYIPSGGTIDDGWRSPISSHSTGEKYKPLPDNLDIYFFSYVNKTFYHGQFDLPYDKIPALFQQGVANNPEHPVGFYGDLGVATGCILIELSADCLLNSSGQTSQLVYSLSDREWRSTVRVEKYKIETNKL